MALLFKGHSGFMPACKQLFKTTKTATRSFSNFQSRSNAAFFRPSRATPVAQAGMPKTPSSAFRDAFKRSYMQPTQSTYQTNNASGNLMQRLLYGGAIVGGTILATNFIFNRETRDDGGMPLFEREYLNQTFLHTGLGVGIIGITARALHTSGWSYRLMAMNPWAVIGISLVASIGSMYGCRATAPEK